MSDEDTPFEPKSRFWLNVPPLLFDSYRDLVRAYADADTRAIYIISFAELLSLALPKEIEDYDEWKKTGEKHPLPNEDPLMKMPFANYGAWLHTLRRIMRISGISGGEKTFEDEDGEVAMMFEDLEV